MGNFFEFVRDNFLHVAPIFIVGGFAIAIVAERIPSLLWTYPLKQANGFFDKIRDLVMADRVAEAIAFCDRYKSKPAAQIVRQGLLRANQPESLIEDGLELAVNDAAMKIGKRTQFLATIANVSTLLGLFGTIVGLIHSFEAVGNAGAQQRASLLASGISTAMNSTMLGLAVAIPCMVFYSYLMNKTNRLQAEMEQTAIRILDLIKQRYYSAEVEVSEHKGNRVA